MINRRTALAGALLAPAAPLVGRRAFADASAFETSALVYVTPIKSDGAESRCKAEVWFGWHEGACYVVTPQDAWRVEAVRRGLTRARLWVGEFGIWTDSDGAFRSAPEHMATASLETDSAVWEPVLAAMGGKYADSGWRTWGDRFRQGLADGERAMVRYAIDA